ncbi:MAG: imidazole glycerol phosphate synthase subunit HisH [Parcubacteria group bacterium CG2_30_36_18]|uniref:Imidazole glycerol phosphate synthase subunit HisH n=2 Tax=Candidatus Nealsoniibacteriota TaxID=1817911 RepID=A0A2M8DM37_9BACT|nr:MAG: imidazole glycerol phosphate synthase subunit HisH [Parcubacteria group bacterium CG2_30_36_18]PIX88641.1 MAG: imidazole glycerol phosphate synthase subunit HisH [Candidatus Nealsonbacteria bacterium CG_4_10_14_3_um_filter_36_16]PJB99011.1 MAG: imidazole glycerol phosphate synthase subunit HisH [Candidatus Nealsonbacteria bacterium CG_4_9_14_0_8_um_filter_36_17]
MITIIDYGMGNLLSIENAFRYFGAKVKITAQPEEIEKAKKLVFPGVGNFAEAIKNLKRKKIDLAIKNSIQKGTPFLGICLGFQLLFEKSEEAPKIKGLSIFQGKVSRLKKVKIPQIGWNQLKIQKKSKILKGLKGGSFVYFMHSFYPKPIDKKIIIAKTNYGIDFCSSIESKNIFGVQFHPEKSGKVGLKILKNFVEI